MAGGSGTRLRPLTCDLPKPMVPIVNRPIIGHILQLLRRHAFDDVVVTLYYLPQAIQTYLGSGEEFGMSVTYAVEGDQPLGTAGSVKAIQHMLRDTFLVISGDALTDYDLTAAVAYHREKKAKATLVLARVSDPMEYGVVITDPEGRITRFLEKPTSSEVFSDTVNTGIYILEPEVLDLLPEGKESDFSKDLFPLLLAKNEPLYGYVAEGYWCDVGNLDTYRQAHYDVLHRRVQVEIPYEERQESVWIGEGVVIEPSVALEAPVLIGNNCYIGHGANLSANTVLGDNVVVGEKSSLKRPIVWSGSYIDQLVSLRGCTLGKGVTVKRESQILEGAVVSDDCAIGERAVIRPTVKVWPSKIIEAGATLSESLVWGTGAPQSLFGQTGISGLVNVDITPELAVRIGAAYGATLGLGSAVAVSRDQAPASRLVSRGLVSGILSVGVHVLNLEDTPIPLSRHQAPHLGVKGGIHIRLDPDNPERALIEFLDPTGIDLSPTMKKKIEGTYFKEDFRRARLNEVGEMSYPSRVKERYIEAFLEQFRNRRLNRPLKVVIDYAFLIGTVILPSLLGRLGVDTVVLNAYLSQQQRDRVRLLQQLSEVVVALKADFGIQLDGNGERLRLVDNRGHVVKDHRLMALLVRLVLEENPGRRVAVPVSAPGILEELALAHGGRVLRTKANSRALMLASQEEGVVLAGDGGRFIFPGFHHGFDGLFTAAMLAHLLSRQDRPLNELVNSLPVVHTLHEQLPCLSSQKGRVMRVMSETSQGEPLDLTDGIKIFTGGGWVLILPDPSESVIHLYADAPKADEARALIDQYRGRIQEILGAAIPV